VSKETFEFVIKESNIVLENQMYVSPKGFIGINKFIDRYVEQQKKILDLEDKLSKAIAELEGYASLEDGKYHGPSDIYENLGEGARKTLEAIEKG